MPHVRLTPLHVISQRHILERALHSGLKQAQPQAISRGHQDHRTAQASGPEHDRLIGIRQLVVAVHTIGVAAGGPVWQLTLAHAHGTQRRLRLARQLLALPRTRRAAHQEEVLPTPDALAKAALRGDQRVVAARARCAGHRSSGPHLPNKKLGKAKNKI